MSYISIMRFKLPSLNKLLIRKCVSVSLLLVSFTVFGQHMDLRTFKKSLSAKEAATANFDYLACFDTMRHEHFSNHQEWIKALEILERNAEEKLPERHAELCTKIAKRLFNEQEQKAAYYFMAKAKGSLASTTPASFAFLPEYHETFGLLNLHFGRYDAARKEFLTTLRLRENDEKEHIGIYNTLGIINRDQGYADSSKYYFQKALDVAKKRNATTWIGILSGNLGSYYFAQGKYEKARVLTTKDFNISLKAGESGSAINALWLLMDIDLKQGKIAEARKKFDQLEKLIMENDYQTSNYNVLYRAKTSLLEAEGKYKEALESFRISARYRDTITKRRDSENLEKTEFQINFERQQAEVLLLKEKEKLNSYKVYALIVFLGMVIIAAWLSLKAAAKRRKREKELAFLKHASIKRELDDTEKEMRKILSNLMEKNQLVEELTEEIQQFQSAGSEEQRQEKERLLDRLQSFTLLTDDDWLDFKKLFEKLNPGFFSKVLSHFPDLTNSEIRLTALIKLNLSNLEMAKVLGISPDSVRKSGLRLRKKLDMEQHEDLVRFILAL